MLEKLKEISKNSQTTKDQILENHNELSLLSKFHNATSRFKGYLFASVMAASMTGCSSLSTPQSQQSLGFQEDVEGYVIGDLENEFELGSNEFYRELLKKSPEEIIEHERDRDYDVDDLTAEILNPKELVSKIMKGEVFKDSDTVYLENPFEKDKPVKVKRYEGGELNKGGRMLTPYMAVSNEQLRVPDTDNKKENVYMVLNMDMIEDEKIKDEKTITVGLYHELAHLHITQEAMLHANHKNMGWERFVYNNKKKFGFDLSEEDLFFTKKMMEIHADITGFLAMKKDLNMSAGDFRKVLSIYGAHREHLEEKHPDTFLHASGKAMRSMESNVYQLSYEIERLPMDEIPFYALSKAFEVGYGMNGSKHSFSPTLFLEGVENDDAFYQSINQNIYILDNLPEEKKTEYKEEVKDLKDSLYELKEIKARDEIRSEFEEGYEPERNQEKIKEVREKSIEFANKWYIGELPDNYKASNPKSWFKNK